MENDFTNEALTLVRKFWAPQQVSRPGDHEKGLSIPRESDFEGQQGLMTELLQGLGEQRLLEGIIKTLCVPEPRRKEQ